MEAGEEIIYIGKEGLGKEEGYAGMGRVSERQNRSRRLYIQVKVSQWKGKERCER